MTARVKPTSPLTPSNLVSVAGRVSDPNNLYYAGLRGGGLEIGQQVGGQNVVLGSVPFAGNIGAWYTLSLSFLVPGTVTGSVTGPGGTSATVSAADPGGLRVGDRVGFYMRTASASLDDIRLSNNLPAPSSSGPTACPVEITMKVGVTFGTAFNATFTLRNISPAPVAPPWTITWRFTSGQMIQSLFNANWFQVGPVVTVQNAVWFPVLPPGATSLTMGFTATGPGPDNPPVDLTFNGSPCQLTFS